jgi:hypothetical protein
MSNENNPMDTATIELEDLLRRECATRGLDFVEMRSNLQVKWMRAALDERVVETEKADAPFKAILERAFRSQQANDEVGYRQACLEWLKLRHDVQPGDRVVLGGWGRPREVRIVDFHIRLQEDNLTQQSFVWFKGPCLSHTIRSASPEDHGQSITEWVRKVG